MLEFIKQLMVFTKFRLSFLVVLSALSGYYFVGGNDVGTLLKLIFGGFLITAASNGANQIIEKQHDAKMSRTENRPLVLKTMQLSTAYVICVLGLLGGSILLYLINLNSFLLGLIAFLSYVFVYTPSKRTTPWSVFIGAIPGAIPPMLGAIAATNHFGFISGLLFFIQFTWQFPHFWSIAWVAHDDYQRAGYFLLPSKSGKSKNTAFFILLYCIFLIPISLIPWLIGATGNASLIIVGICGVWFYFLAYRLYITCETSDAKKLMFASFVYLPVVQFTYVFNRVDHIIKQCIDHGLF